MQLFKFAFFGIAAAVMVVVLISVINSLYHRLVIQRRSKRDEDILEEIDRQVLSTRREAAKSAPGNVRRENGEKAFLAVENDTLRHPYVKFIQDKIAALSIQPVTHELWCPKCGSHDKHLRLLDTTSYWNCDACGTNYQYVGDDGKRWDRNAVDKPSDAPSVAIYEWISDYPLPGEAPEEQNGHWPSVVLGSGAGDPCTSDSSSDSGSSYDSGSSSDSGSSYDSPSGSSSSYDSSSSND